jgi:D-tyrosyl-tRNA(Tyr) deacylase
VSNLRIVILSEPDPVAAAVSDLWGTPPASGAFVDGVPVRVVRPKVWALRRPVPHIHDDGLDDRVSAAVGPEVPMFLFPSVHRSESGRPCLTVHPLGNLGPDAEVGGRPRTVNPTAPRAMADALRRFHEAGDRHGLVATYEATHHGPVLRSPAFFLEIGADEEQWRRPELVRAVADTLLELDEDPTDRVAIGVGGGHYAPRFTDLALRRRWAFGHLIPSYALPRMTAETARAVRSAVPGSDGAVFARASDVDAAVSSEFGPRLRESDAPRREEGGGDGRGPA